VSPKAKRILYTTIIVAAVNFASCWVVGVAIGGDALNGKIEGDRYYLGRYHTEVSAGVYWYSYIHAITMICTHIAAIFCGLVLVGSASARGNR
jgi:hypothetical protein